MTFAEMLRGSPLNQQRMADAPDPVPLLMDTMPMAGITAWHGSPHKFSKFDMSKIGTGEGAQAYGHGLYFAENPKVAKDYARKLARDHIQYTDPVLDKYNPIWKELSIQDKQLTQKIANSKNQHEFNRLQDARGKVNDEMDRIQKIMIEEGGKQVKAQKSLYKVDIPDDQIAKMLDWDKTLSEQSKSVKESLKRYGVLRSTKPITQSTEPNGRIIFRDEQGKMVATAIPDGKRYKLSSTTANLEGFSLNRPAVDKKQAQKVAEGWWSGNNITGEQLVQGMGRSEEGARALRKHGIPGIKYLDQGSRQGGKGTSNFVLFADDIAKILERNDQPIGDLAEELQRR